MMSRLASSGCHALISAWVLVGLCGETARAEGRFFLIETSLPPSPGLVERAFEEARETNPVTVSPLGGKARLGRAFPRLFGLGQKVEVSVLEAELKAARGAHLDGAFAEAEGGFARLFQAANEAPEVLSASPGLVRQLSDAAVLRYQNLLALRRPPDEALKTIADFAQRFPFAVPSSVAHPPQVIAIWQAVRAQQQRQSVSIAVNVHPLELERGGQCVLHVNGAEVATLPMAGPVALPKGEHLMQVRCGNQLGWLTRVEARDAPIALVVPVRAMMAARGEPVTGGIVLVGPGEGDAGALVGLASELAGFDGATVARTAVAKVEFGTWEAGMSGPSVDSVGRLRGSDIVDIREVGGDGKLETWAWVAGGVGVSSLVAAIGLNVAHEVERSDGATAKELQGLERASVGMYIASGALLATSVVLFLLDADEGEHVAWRGVSPYPGGFVVRF
jgi:hypothetical protein